MFRKKFIKKLERKLNNLCGLISIARKAGYVIIGQDNLKNYDKKLYLLLLDSSAGVSLTREMNFLARKHNIPLQKIDNLGELAGVENCKALGIKNKAFAENIIKNLKGDF